MTDPQTISYRTVQLGARSSNEQTVCPQQAQQVADRYAPRARRRVMSLSGGSPNTRLYSLLNWVTLS